MSTYKIISNDYQDFYIVFFGFIGGLIGWPIKQLPLFFLVPLAIMLLLIKIKLKQKWFISYTISICFAYLTKYIWLFFDSKENIILGYPDAINTVYFIIPSLVVSIFLNWLIFRKTYIKLGL